MGNESLEAQLARIDERLRLVMVQNDKAEASRKEQYQFNERIERTVGDMSVKVTNVENKLATASPTIEEFITIKHKIVGAGKLGKYLWLAGGALITLAYNSREAILKWLGH